jgi:transposase
LDKRQILSGVFYQLKNGCNWCDLPKDLPPYSTVYWHYKQWRDPDVLKQMITTLHSRVRQQVKKTNLDKVAEHRFTSGEKYLQCQCEVRHGSAITNAPMGLNGILLSSRWVFRFYPLHSCQCVGRLWLD